MSNKTPEQKTQEIVALEAKKDNIHNYLMQNADELWLVAAEHMKHSGTKEKTFMRIAQEISQDQKLAKCFQTPEGKRSIADVMRECLEMGVIPDGKEAYVIPYGDIANLEPKAEAYRKILISEPNPLFKDVEFDIIYSEDDISIDTGQGLISHKINPIKPRGEISGVWVKFARFDGTNIVKFWHVDRINKVRDEKSDAYGYYLKNLEEYDKYKSGELEAKSSFVDKSGNIAFKKQDGKFCFKPDTPWESDYEAMAIKTVLKAECKPWATIKPGLERAMDIEKERQATEPSQPEPTTSQPDDDYDITLTASDIVGSANDSMIIDAKYSEVIKEEPEQEQKKPVDNNDDSLIIEE